MKQSAGEGFYKTKTPDLQAEDPEFSIGVGPDQESLSSLTSASMASAVGRGMTDSMFCGMLG